MKRTRIVILIIVIFLLLGCGNSEIQEQNNENSRQKVVQEHLEASTQWLVEPGEPMKGTDDLRFGVGFLPEQQNMTLAQAIETLSQQDIFLYNFTASDVEIVLTDNAWTYRVYRVNDGQVQEVYSKTVYDENMPFYSGALPSCNVAYNSFHVEYWNEKYAKSGKYKIVLEHPNMLLYRDESGELQRVLFAEGTDGNLFFACEVTIQ